MSTGVSNYCVLWMFSGSSYSVNALQVIQECGQKLPRVINSNSLYSSIMIQYSLKLTLLLTYTGKIYRL